MAENDSSDETGTIFTQALPSSTQITFHPDFCNHVRTVAFLVEGQGFITDTARLTIHSEFFRSMLMENQHIGRTNEGTNENPIVVEGCTKEAFANFMLWLNHKQASNANFPWEILHTNHIKQLTDILHVAHMWEIQPAIDFAVDGLEQFLLRPSHKLNLAARYKIRHWIPLIIRDLLLTPFYDFTAEDADYIGFPVYISISRAKDEILRTRRMLASVAPWPPNFETAAFCTKHNLCQKVWYERWSRVVARCIHWHPTALFPLSDCVSALHGMEHKGMNSECKSYVLDWMLESCLGLGKEEALIEKVVAAVYRIYDIDTL